MTVLGDKQKELELSIKGSFQKKGVKIVGNLFMVLKKIIS